MAESKKQWIQLTRSSILITAFKQARYMVSAQRAQGAQKHAHNYIQIIMLFALRDVDRMHSCRQWSETQYWRELRGNRRMVVWQSSYTNCIYAFTGSHPILHHCVDILYMLAYSSVHVWVNHSKIHWVTISHMMHAIRIHLVEKLAHTHTLCSIPSWQR